MSRARAPLDPAFMELALALARESRPSPNPRVGAVIVKNGKVVGRGFHEKPGKPHAEIVALEEAGLRARGGDIYITLEPCCHHGKTGPCVDALKKAGVRRVAIGMIDPDRRVNGKGIARLKQEGVECDIGILGDACRKMLEGYTTHRTTGRPLVTLKAAVTLDGALASVTGDSKWISTRESQVEAHRMRASADAVLVGIETVLKDDPELTVRHCPGPNPVRIVLDSRLRTPPEAKLVRSAPDGPVIIACAKATRESVRRLTRPEGVEILRCKPLPGGGVDPEDLLKKLGARGILSLLVEGGSRVHGTFVKAGLADRIALFLAPKILGSGIPWIAFAGRSTVKEALTVQGIEIRRIGGDLLIEGRLSYRLGKR